jgi:hypothetical protein
LQLQPPEAGGSGLNPLIDPSLPASVAGPTPASTPRPPLELLLLELPPPPPLLLLLEPPPPLLLLELPLPPPLLLPLLLPEPLLLPLLEPLPPLLLPLPLPLLEPLLPPLLEPLPASGTTTGTWHVLDDESHVIPVQQATPPEHVAPVATHAQLTPEAEMVWHAVCWPPLMPESVWTMKLFPQHERCV